MSGDFAALEAARTARGGCDPFSLTLAPNPTRAVPSFKRTDFAVGRVYDEVIGSDGKSSRRPFEPLRFGFTRDIAESVAGRMRDAMTDDEVKAAFEGGYNIGYQMVRGTVPKGQPKFKFVPRAPKPRAGFQDVEPAERRQLSLIGNQRRMQALTPERRIEIARKANAARGWKCSCGKPATQRVPWKYGRFHRLCDGCAK